MSTTPIPIDIKRISTTKDLLRLAEEVKQTNTPRALTNDDETVAVLMPVGKEARPLQKRDKKAVEETLALAGAWGERDWTEVEQELDRIRHHSKPTPPFKP